MRGKSSARRSACTKHVGASSSPSAEAIGTQPSRFAGKAAFGRLFRMRSRFAVSAIDGRARRGPWAHCAALRIQPGKSCAAIIASAGICTEPFFVDIRQHGQPGKHEASDARGADVGGVKRLCAGADCGGGSAREPASWRHRTRLRSPTSLASAHRLGGWKPWNASSGLFRRIAAWLSSSSSTSRRTSAASWTNCWAGSRPWPSCACWNRWRSVPAPSTSSPPARKWCCREGNSSPTTSRRVPNSAYPSTRFSDRWRGSRGTDRSPLSFRAPVPTAASASRTCTTSGGLVLAQSEETAKFDGMPKSAIATGCVDAVLAPEDMPAPLLEYVRDPSHTLSALRPTRASSDELTGVAAVFEKLREIYNLDFNYYKSATITRRMDRRASLGRLGHLQGLPRSRPTRPRRTGQALQGLC